MKLKKLDPRGSARSAIPLDLKMPEDKPGLLFSQTNVFRHRNDRFGKENGLISLIFIKIKADI